MCRDYGAKMKVYLLWECYHNSKNTRTVRYLAKIFTNENEAIAYKEELQDYDEWRELEVRETE